MLDIIRLENTLTNDNTFEEDESIQIIRDINHKDNANKSKENEIIKIAGNFVIKLSPISFKRIQQNYNFTIFFAPSEGDLSLPSLRIYNSVDSSLTRTELETLLKQNTGVAGKNGLFFIISKLLNKGGVSVIEAVSDSIRSSLRDSDNSGNQCSTFVCELSGTNIATFSFYIAIVETGK